MLRVVQGKGGIDREVPLSKTLLKTLREYYRWMKPQTYLFPRYREWTGVRTSPSPKRWSGLPYASLRSAPVSRSKLLRIPSGIVLRRTCWSPAQICEPFR